MSGPRQRIAQNPFYVLGVGVDATRAEVEREGQKLIGMLALGLSAARRYDTPMGPCERTEADVRAAMAELRDPVRRARHALWARLPAEPRAPADPGVADPPATAPAAEPPPWPRALEVLGWHRAPRRRAHKAANPRGGAAGGEP